MKRKFRILVFLVLSFPKTVYFNLRMFPISIAMRLPMLIGYRIKILEMHRGMITLPKKIYPGMISIGYGGSRGVSANKKGYLCLEKGSVIFKGKAVFAEGASIRVNGTLILGDNFSANKNCFISCTDRIEFGRDVLLGWNCSIRDSDGHTIVVDGINNTPHAPVTIGNHVWICSEAHILKGVHVGDDSVVAYKSLLTSNVQNNCLVGGAPAKQISNNINWCY